MTQGARTKRLSRVGRKERVSETHTHEGRHVSKHPTEHTGRVSEDGPHDNELRQPWELCARSPTNQLKRTNTTQRIRMVATHK